VRLAATALLASMSVTGCADRTCAEGLYRTHDGRCVELGGEGEKNPMPEGGDTLPDCDRLPVGGEIDFVRGCIEGACVNQTLAELEANLGEPAQCENAGTGSVRCSFRGDTVSVLLEDSNNDSVPDDPAEEVFGLHVDEGYTGSSASGLGMGVSLRCYLEDFIAINEVITNDVDGVDQIVTVWFDNPSMFVDDAVLFDGYDGYVSDLSVYGP